MSLLYAIFLFSFSRMFNKIHLNIFSNFHSQKIPRDFSEETKFPKLSLLHEMTHLPIKKTYFYQNIRLQKILGNFPKLSSFWRKYKFIKALNSRLQNIPILRKKRKKALLHYRNQRVADASYTKRYASQDLRLFRPLDYPPFSVTSSQLLLFPTLLLSKDNRRNYS